MIKREIETKTPMTPKPKTLKCNPINIRALKVLLLHLEVTSGLKVNFHKSMLLSVNIHDSWLAEAVSIINCKLGKLPFLYLGLPIGGDPRKLKFW